MSNNNDVGSNNIVITNETPLDQLVVVRRRYTDGAWAIDTRKWNYRELTNKLRRYVDNLNDSGINIILEIQNIMNNNIINYLVSYKRTKHLKEFKEIACNLNKILLKEAGCIDYNEKKYVDDYNI